jgi:hypothetical protein
VYKKGDEYPVRSHGIMCLRSYYRILSIVSMRYLTRVVSRS